jgi:hypothetical protein
LKASQIIAKIDREEKKTNKMLVTLFGKGKDHFLEDGSLKGMLSGQNMSSTTYTSSYEISLH